MKKNREYKKYYKIVYTVDEIVKKHIQKAEG